jgi:chemotaxis protein MotB
MVELGFPARNLAAAGYADTDPVAKNKNAKGRQKNRRIEIIVVPDLSDLPKLAKQPAE